MPESSSFRTLNALIVGAGPTGLVLAIELAKRQLSVRIIDQLDDPTHQSRALGLQSRTLEIFQQMGLIDSFLKKGRIIKEGTIYLNQKPLAKMDFGLLKTPFPFLLSIPQRETESILTSHLKSFSVEIERGVVLEKLEHNVATIQHPNGFCEQVKADWIFGCDGAHSTVRDCLNLAFEGEKQAESFALADVKIKTPLPHNSAHIFLNPNGLIGIIPLPESDWYRLIVNAPERKESTWILEDFETIAKNHIPHPITFIESKWISTFTVQRRIVPKMRKGHVFLLGDAAHIHSPVGGQGLNTSVQDAHNLGWKIALVHQKIGHPLLLDSFELERQPIAKAVLTYTTFATHWLNSQFIKRWLLPLLKPFFHSLQMQRKIVEAASELNISYQNSPIVNHQKKRAHSLIGKRAPDALLPDGTHLFSQLNHPDHTLLCFGASPLLCSLLERDYKKIIRLIQIPLQPLCEMHLIYQVSTPYLFLIRPDGYIAFASPLLPFDPLLSYLKKVFITSYDLQKMDPSR